MGGPAGAPDTKAVGGVSASRIRSAAIAVRVPSRSVMGMMAMSVLAALLAPTGAGAQTLDCYTLWPQTPPWGAWELADGSSSTYTPCELYQPASSDLSSEFGVEIEIYVPEGWLYGPPWFAPPKNY